MSDEDNKWGLVANIVRTPDGTTLRSRHRHGFMEHVDSDGKTYFTDGGIDYVRTNAENISIYATEPIEKIREYFEWGTYGKSGDDDLTYIKLTDMSIDHIYAVLAGELLTPKFRYCFEKELLYRKYEETQLKDK